MNGESPGDDELGPEDHDRADDEGGGLRGWIPPDDRLWRHPSETGHPAGTRPPSGLPPADRSRRRSGRWMIGGAAVLTVGALVVAGLAIATTGASPGASGGSSPATTARLATPTTEPPAVHLASATVMARVLGTVRPSLVALDVTRSSGVAEATGISAEAGGIIVTTMAAVAGATTIDTQEADGTWEPVEMVGQDRTSGIAVLRGSADLPVAGFDLRDPAPGSTAMAVAVIPGSSRAAAPAADVYAGTVSSSGSAVGADAATTTFASTAVEAPLGPQDQGCALLDADGEVTGILDTTRSGSSGVTAVFLPAALVMGVTHQLVADGTIERGWLGIDASDATSSDGGAPSGAVLDTVDPGGAAALAGLRVGDTIVALGGDPVHSVAELRTRLYADLPGSTLQVTYLRDGAQGTTDAVLSATDAAASGGGSPP